MSSFMVPLYMYTQKFIFNYGVCLYTWALQYITQGFHPSSHTKRIRQIHRIKYFYIVFAYKYQKDLEATDKLKLNKPEIPLNAPKPTISSNVPRLNPHELNLGKSSTFMSSALGKSLVFESPLSTINELFSDQYILDVALPTPQVYRSHIRAYHISININIVQGICIIY